MSVIFEVNETTIWDPASRVGRLFVAQAKALEAVLDQPSGIDEVMGDTFAIDPQIFGRFISRALKTLEDTNHGALFALMVGCVQVALALNAKITGEWPTVQEPLLGVLQGAQTALQAIHR